MRQIFFPETRTVTNILQVTMSAVKVFYYAMSTLIVRVICNFHFHCHLEFLRDINVCKKTALANTGPDLPYGKSGQLFFLGRTPQRYTHFLDVDVVTFMPGKPRLMTDCFISHFDNWESDDTSAGHDALCLLWINKCAGKIIT